MGENCYKFEVFWGTEVDVKRNVYPEKEDKYENMLPRMVIILGHFHRLATQTHR